jgi:hypothetical protein
MNFSIKALNYLVVYNSMVTHNQFHRSYRILIYIFSIQQTFNFVDIFKAVKNVLLK